MWVDSETSLFKLLKNKEETYGQNFTSSPSIWDSDFSY